MASANPNLLFANLGRLVPFLAPKDMKIGDRYPLTKLEFLETRFGQRLTALVDHPEGQRKIVFPAKYAEFGDDNVHYINSELENKKLYFVVVAEKRGTGWRYDLVESNENTTR
jgi:hypothetical protein